MKKKYWIIGFAVVALSAVVVFIYSRINVAVDRDSSAVSVIGGADGPTSIFIAGKTGGDTTVEYKSITMAEAKELFAESGDYTILDVRRADEFAKGHIPGAINISNEDIGAKMPEDLPDLDTVIYVYCRSGRRSKEAAGKLAALGYTNVIECGGIIDWTGAVDK